MWTTALRGRSSGPTRLHSRDTLGSALSHVTLGCDAERKYASTSRCTLMKTRHPATSKTFRNLVMTEPVRLCLNPVNKITINHQDVYKLISQNPLRPHLHGCNGVWNGVVVPPSDVSGMRHRGGCHTVRPAGPTLSNLARSHGEFANTPRLAL